MAESIRPPAVAGAFYPADPVSLQATVEALLADAEGELPDDTPPSPGALVAPHAGYVYSGPVAARAYATLLRAQNPPRRVLLLGPAHYVPLKGLALPGADALSTPLGAVPVDAEGAAEVSTLPEVVVSMAAHAPEHSLEVHLPFLQVVLGDVPVIPVVVGRPHPEALDALVDALWDEGTLVVVSTDLSHYLPYAVARQVDAETAAAVESLDAEALTPERACGAVPLAGLLRVARARGVRPRRLDLRNSGDTSGDRTRVVGYGAWALA